MRGTQGQDAERLLNLHPNLLDAKQQEGDDSSGRDHGQAAGLPQREGHGGQPHDQKPRSVPVASM